MWGLDLKKLTPEQIAAAKKQAADEKKKKDEAANQDQAPK